MTSAGVGFDIRFQQLLAERIQERIEARTGHLQQGIAKTYDAYREAVGYIRACNDIREDAAEIAKKLKES